MQYPIVQIKTKDGCFLHGLFIEAKNPKAIFINIHGTASNFYEEDFIEYMAEKFVQNGISLLSVNNRGAGVYDAYQKTGAAVEKFEDSIKDIDGWIEFAFEKNYSKIILSGHSLGTEKVVYYLSNGSHIEKVSGVVLLAPADSFGSHRMHEGMSNPRSQEVETLLKQSRELFDSGSADRFLTRYAYGSHEGIMPKSAESFFNFLGPDSKLQEALPFSSGKLESYSKIQVPILVVIGNQFEYTGVKTDVALRLMQKENKKTQIVKLTNCDHDFTGCEEVLANSVLNFILSKVLSE